MRASGRTTRQMKSAAPNSYYLFPGARAYYEELKRQINRPDLQLIDTNQARLAVWRGTRRPVMIDHASHLASVVLEMILEHNSRFEDEHSRVHIIKAQVAAYSRGKVLVYREDRGGLFEGINPDLAKMIGPKRKKFFYAIIVDTQWCVLGEAPWQEW